MGDQDEALAAAVRDLADPLAAALEVEVLEVRVAGPPGRRVVRITADLADPAAEGGLDVDTVARLSRRLGGALDEHDPIAGGYTLEVSSPGADRPLTRPRDFARNRGRRVRVVADELTGTLTGEVVEVDATAVTLDVDGERRRVAFEDVAEARVQLPW